MNTQIESPAHDTLCYDPSGEPIHATALENQSPDDAAQELDEPTTLELVELLLKAPAKVDRLNRREDVQPLLLSRFLLITEASYLIFGIVMLLLLNRAPAAAYPRLPWLAMPPADWTNATALALPLAYMIGIVLAACVCLPSFYFYSLLAGVKLTWLQITSVVAKGTASNAIMLLGLLPAYVAVVLGLIIFDADVEVLQWALLGGLLLPFASGLWGLRAIFLGVKDMASVLSRQWHCQRWCFLRRMVLAWTAVYATVVPVMIYRLWDYFAHKLG